MKKRRLKFKVERALFEIKYWLKSIYRKIFVIPKGRKRPPMDLIWEEDYDWVTDSVIKNGIMYCPHCFEMPYSTEECVFCGQRFTEESAMKGNLPPEPIEYKSENGYTGVLYGWHSFSIKDKRGREVFHTGSRNFDTYERLVEEVEGFPEFSKKLSELTNKLDNIEEEDDGI